MKRGFVDFSFFSYFEIPKHFETLID